MTTFKPSKGACAVRQWIGALKASDGVTADSRFIRSCQIITPLEGYGEERRATTFLSASPIDDSRYASTPTRDASTGIAMPTSPYVRDRMLSPEVIKTAFAVVLEPCPFCAGDAFLVTGPSPHVICTHCQATGPTNHCSTEDRDQTLFRALQAWNVRT